MCLLGAAVWVAVSHRHELSEAIGMFGHVRAGWLILAVCFQVSSMLAFARLQRWLLRAGGVNLRVPTMVEITLAGNAMGTTLPGGAAWAAAWAFGQLRRRGADRILAGWVLLVAGALSSFAIFLILVVGSFVAGSHGPVAHLRWLALGLALIPVVVALSYFVTTRSERAKVAAERIWQVAGRRLPHGRALESGFVQLVERVRTVQPSRLGWVEVFGLALANWLADCATLICSLLALGVSVPWQGILVTYGLVQVSASLPVTPGGIGVVEGSMTALLVAYGVSVEAALAGTLMYRLVSFWGLVPVGWGVWGYLELKQRTRAEARRPHPWAFHSHAHGDGAAKPVAPRLLRSTPCEDCDETEPAKAGPASGGASAEEGRVSAGRGS